MKLTERVGRIKGSPSLAMTALGLQMRAQGIDVVSFSAGEPDFDTPEHIKEAAIRAIREGFTKYTAVEGIVELKDAIIHRLKEDYGLAYARGNIIVSNGGKHSLYNIAQALFEAGDEVIIPAPYWVSYPDQVLLNDAIPVIIPTSGKTGFKVSPQALRQAMTPKTKAFILNSPSNPAGAAYTKEELASLAQVLVEKQVMCISDEIYDKIVYGDFRQTSIACLGEDIKKLTVIVNGASKVYSMTGWRMGYAAAPEELTQAMGKIQSQSTSNICSITQKACVAAFSGPQDCLTPMIAEFKKRRDYIVGRLNRIPGMTCYNPEGAFYVFPNMEALYGRKTPAGREILSDADFAAYLLNDHQVVVVPGDSFGAPGYVRLSYATSMGNIEKGLERIGKAVAQLS